MLDLGTTWLASVARDPDALAIVDGRIRLTYAEWHERIAGLAAGFAAMGLTPGDHVVTLLHSGWEAATIHWAAQLAGLVHTPLDMSLSAEDVAALLDDCEATALVYQPGTAAYAAPSAVVRIALGAPARGEIAFDDLLEEPASDPIPQVGADAWSAMVYVDGGPTGRCGVPRRHRAQRAAALAHVAHNQYGPGERILGATPLNEEAGLRCLLAAALVGGTYICQPVFDTAETLALIEQEKVSALYLRPERFEALLAHPGFGDADISSVGRVCVAGTRLLPAFVQRLDWMFRPKLFISLYGCAEVPLCAVNSDPLARPASAGRAGYNQLLRVVTAEAVSPDDQAAPGEEGRIIALIDGDDAFEGYWRRPDADRLALHDGWFLTGDLGYFAPAGDLFVTGRIPMEEPDIEAEPALHTAG